MIMEYVSERVTMHEIETRDGFYKSMGWEKVYFQKVESQHDSYIDATLLGNSACFANHS